jgi:hypothetical protein
METTEVGETAEEIGATGAEETVTTGVRPVRGVVGYRGGDPSPTVPPLITGRCPQV